MKIKNIASKISIKILKSFLPNKSVLCKGPGFKIYVRPPRTSSIGRSIYLKGIWERDMTKVVENKIKDGWHILDVGADIGYYSLLFALKCGSDGAVAAFEPDPEAWPYLNKNINMFKYSNIYPFNLALSNHSGKGMMKSGGRGQLYPDKKGYNNQTSTVKMVKFDTFWPKLSWEKIDLIKIDVEGAELTVLEGMEKIIKKYHPHLLIEIHPRQLKEIFNSSANEVYNFLTKLSYKLTPVDSKTLNIPKNGNITIWAEWSNK